MSEATAIPRRSSAPTAKPRLLASPLVQEGLLAAAVFMLAFSSIFTIRGLFYHAGYVDPWIYTGLIENYSDVVSRTGSTYYAARIGHIFPSIAFDAVFGRHLGVLVYYASVLSMGGYVLFRLVRKIYGPAIGLAAAAALSYSPWLLPSFAYDMYEGVALCWLLVAVAAGTTPNRHARLLLVGAGLALGMAVNITTFTVGLFAFFAPAWVIAQRRRGWSECAILAACGIGGFAVSTGAINIILRITHETWRRNDPTLSVVTGFMNGALKEWYYPFSYLFESKLYVFAAPIAAGIWALIALVLRGKSETSAASGPREVRSIDVTLAMASLPFLWFAQELVYYFFLQFNPFAWPHYMVYLLIPTVMAAAVAMGESCRRAPAWAHWVALASIAAPLAAVQFFSDDVAVSIFGKPSFMAYAIAAGAAAVLAGGLLLLRQRVLGATVFGLAAAVLLLTPYASSNYFQSQRQPSKFGWDIRDGARFLTSLTAQTARPDEGKIGYFYHHQDFALRSAQSAELWGFSRVEEKTDPFPALDEDTANRMSGFNPVIIMSSDPAELDAAFGEMKKNAWRLGEPVVEKQGKFVGPHWGYNYSVVRRKDVPIKPAPNSTGFMDLAGVNTPTSLLPAASKMEGAIVHIDSYPKPGGWSAMIDIPEAMRRPGPGYVRVWMDITKGAFQIWPGNQDDPSKLNGSPASAQHTSGSLAALAVPVDDLSRPTRLLFINADWSTSTAKVHAIEVVSRPDAARRPEVGGLDIAAVHTAAMWAPASVNTVDGKPEITSHPGSGAFSAALDITAASGRSGPATVRVRMSVTDGAFMVWLADPNDGNKLRSQRAVIAPGGQADLRIDDIGKPSILIFANGGDKGASKGSVQSVAVLPP